MSAFACCHQCGQLYTSQTWPRNCTSCGLVHCRGSQSVAVALIPVEFEGGSVSLMTIQRNIEPKKGQWALPGGYVDYNESLEQAACREVQEETGLVLNPDLAHLHHSSVTPDGKVLVFVKTQMIHIQDVLELKNKTLDHETQDIGWVTHDTVWAFPLHKQAFERWLEETNPQQISTPHMSLSKPR